MSGATSPSRSFPALRSFSACLDDLPRVACAIFRFARAASPGQESHHVFLAPSCGRRPGRVFRSGRRRLRPGLPGLAGGNRSRRTLPSRGRRRVRRPGPGTARGRRWESCSGAKWFIARGTASRTSITASPSHPRRCSTSPPSPSSSGRWRHSCLRATAGWTSTRTCAPTSPNSPTSGSGSRRGISSITPAGFATGCTSCRWPGWRGATSSPSTGSCACSSSSRRSTSIPAPSTRTPTPATTCSPGSSRRSRG